MVGSVISDQPSEGDFAIFPMAVGQGYTIMQWNVTSLNKDKINWLLTSSQHHTIILQEHKLEGKALESAKKKLSKKYHVTLSPCHKTEGGKCAGIGILVQKNLSYVC